MARPLLPPKGVFLGTRVFFDDGLPAPVKETLLQLMALAWQSDSHCTPALTYALLTHLTGKSDRTLRGHFLMLRAYQAVLRLQPAGTGQFIIALADGLFDNRVAWTPIPVTPRPAEDGPEAAGQALAAQQALNSGKVLPAPYHDENQEEEDLSQLETLYTDLPPLPDDHDHTADENAPKARTPKLKKAFAERLQEAGVFPHLLREIAEKAAGGEYSQNELEALLDWCLAETPDRPPAGLFIYRMRQGVRVPGKLMQPPCPRCGKRGSHSPECPQRYLMDPE